MKKTLLAIACMMTATAYAAVGDFGATYTTDSDKFNSQYIWAGAEVADGVGIRAGTVRYTGPSITATGETLQATYNTATTKSRTTGAVGVKSVKYDSNSRTYQYGNAEYEYDATDQLTVGINVDRDIVESDSSIRNHVEYLTIGVNSSYQVSDTVTVTAAASNTHFNDSNDRLKLNTKIVWSILPDSGVSVYARAAYQTDSNGGSRNYTSPERANTLSAGAQIRRRHGGLLYNAAVEVGRVTENFEFANIGSDLYVLRVGLQTIPKNNSPITYGLSLIDLHKTGIEQYQWTGLYSWLRIEF